MIDNAFSECLLDTNVNGRLLPFIISTPYRITTWLILGYAWVIISLSDHYRCEGWRAPIQLEGGGQAGVKKIPQYQVSFDDEKLESDGNDEKSNERRMSIGG